MSDVGISSGSTWDAKDGRRTIQVLKELSPWRGERQFLVHSKAGRTYHISYSGLMRKYRRAAS